MKKSFMLGTITLFTMAIPTTAFAATTSTPTSRTTAAQKQHDQQVIARISQIRTILSKMGQERSRKALLAAENAAHHQVSSNLVSSQTSVAAISSKLNNQTAKLKAIGVKQITATQAQAIQQSASNSPSSTQAMAASSSSDVDWYSYNYSYVESGQKYDIKELYAQGLNGNSNLDNGRVGAIMYSSQNWEVSSLQTLASIYAQKIIGTAANVSLVTSWAPYELLYNSNTDGSVVKIDKESVNWNATETVDFSYVEKAGQSSTQRLSLTSNMETVAWTQIFGGWYSDGQPYNKSKSGTTNIYTSDYANPGSDVNAYRGQTSSSPVFNSIDKFTFWNPNHTKYVSQIIDDPEYPGQVF